MKKIFLLVLFLVSTSVAIGQNRLIANSMIVEGKNEYYVKQLPTPCTLDLFKDHMKVDGIDTEIEFFLKKQLKNNVEMHIYTNRKLKTFYEFYFQNGSLYKIRYQDGDYFITLKTVTKRA